MDNDGVPPKKLGHLSGSFHAIKKSAFMHVIKYLGHDNDGTVTLDELHEVMIKQAGSDEIHSKKNLFRDNCRSVMVNECLSHLPNSSH